LQDALDFFVCAPVDFVAVLAKAIQKPADFFRHACHGEKLVRLVDVFACRAGAPTAKPVDQMPGLIRRDTAGQAARVLGTVDQRGALCVLRFCCAVEVL